MSRGTGSVFSARGDIGRLASTTAGVRAIVLPLTAAASLISTREMISTLGVETYAAIALLLAIPLLVPFLDFGLGAVVTNAVGAYLRGSCEKSELNAVYSQCVRRLCLVPLLGATFGILAAVFGWWRPVLGLESLGNGIDVASTIVLVGFLLGVPLALGMRLLVGLRRASLMVCLSAAQPILFSVLLVILGERITPIVVAVVFATSLLVPVCIATLIGVMSLRLHYTDAAYIGEALSRTAFPMLAVTIMLPVTFQAGRWVLAHRGSPVELASYSVALQVALALVSVATSAGASFWGSFASVEFEALRSLWVKALKVCIFLGAMLSGLWFAFGNFVIDAASSGKLAIPAAAFACFGGVIFIQTVHQASAMLLTRGRGLQYQAVTASLAAVSTVLLTWCLVPHLGVTAPVIALAVSYSGFQLVPCIVIGAYATRSSDGDHALLR